MGKPNLELIEKVRALASVDMSSTELAAVLGLNSRHVRKILLKHDMPRPREGGRRGAANHQYISGRRVSLNGYVLITPPEGHSTAKPRKGRLAGYMLEHRYVMEQTLGRPLLRTERVDHIDGLTLHNHPSNLRVFASNALHLQETLTGKVPQWSSAGFEHMKLKYRLPADFQPVDTHRLRTEAGATRLRQILLAALQLGIDSPYLLGTQRWLAKAGIADLSRSNLERELEQLYQRWGWAHAL